MAESQISKHTRLNYKRLLLFELVKQWVRVWSKPFFKFLSDAQLVNFASCVVPDCCCLFLFYRPTGLSVVARKDLTTPRESKSQHRFRWSVLLNIYVIKHIRHSSRLIVSQMIELLCPKNCIKKQPSDWPITRFSHLFTYTDTHHSLTHSLTHSLAHWLT